MANSRLLEEFFNSREADSISRTIVPRHTDRAPIEESSYQFWIKTGKNGRTYGATGVDLPTICFYRCGTWSSVFFLHTISRAAARGQDNEFLLISILLFYLFSFWSALIYHMYPCAKKIIPSDYLILKKKISKLET